MAYSQHLFITSTTGKRKFKRMIYLFSYRKGKQSHYDYYKNDLR